MTIKFTPAPGGINVELHSQGPGGRPIVASEFVPFDQVNDLARDAIRAKYLSVGPTCDNCGQPVFVAQVGDGTADPGLAGHWKHVSEDFDTQDEWRGLWTCGSPKPAFAEVNGSPVAHESLAAA
jgi:hypothetical protein